MNTFTAVIRSLWLLTLSLLFSLPQAKAQLEINLNAGYHLPAGTDQSIYVSEENDVWRNNQDGSNVYMTSDNNYPSFSLGAGYHYGIGASYTWRWSWKALVDITHFHSNTWNSFNSTSYKFTDENFPEDTTFYSYGTLQANYFSLFLGLAKQFAIQERGYLQLGLGPVLASPTVLEKYYTDTTNNLDYQWDMEYSGGIAVGAKAMLGYTFVWRRLHINASGFYQYLNYRPKNWRITKNISDGYDLLEETDPKSGKMEAPEQENQEKKMYNWQDRISDYSFPFSSFGLQLHLGYTFGMFPKPPRKNPYTKRRHKRYR
mgnify:CR=1 FL=1